MRFECNLNEFSRRYEIEQKGRAACDGSADCTPRMSVNRGPGVLCSAGWCMGAFRVSDQVCEFMAEASRSCCSSVELTTTCGPVILRRMLRVCRSLARQKKEKKKDTKFLLNAFMQ